MTTVEKRRRVWTSAEDALIMEAIKKHGFNWKKVASEIPTRTPLQCKSHYQRFSHKLGRDTPPPKVPKLRYLVTRRVSALWHVQWNDLYLPVFVNDDS